MSIFTFCVWVFACMYTCASHVCSAHRGQRRHWTLWNWCHRWLLAMWVLGTTPLQEQNVLDCWAISLGSQGWTQTHNPISSVRILQMCYLTRKSVFCFAFKFYNRIWNYSEEFYFIIAINMEIQIILNISHLNLD